MASRQRWTSHRRGGDRVPDKNPLLAFISLVMPAVVRANTVVVIASETAPLCATDLYQVLDTSDLPGGVINILTGNRDHISKVRLASFVTSSTEQMLMAV